MSQDPKTVSIRQREYVPINRTAAQVISGGESYDWNYTGTDPVWDAPPPFYTTPPKKKKNIIGTKRGMVTIIGWMGKDRWAGRCACGKYVQRDGVKWRKGLNRNIVDDGCPHCNKRKRLTNIASRLSMGVKMERKDQ